MPHLIPSSRWIPLAAAAVTTVMTGCEHASIRTYETALDPSAYLAAAPPAEAGAATRPARLDWQAPAHWTSRPPGSMQLAQFLTSSGASVTVAAFPGDVGGDLANLNRWRGQLSLPPASPAELPALIRTEDLLGRSWKHVRVEADPAESANAVAVYWTAFSARTWFIKLTGPAATVADELPALRTFAASFAFPES